MPLNAADPVRPRAGAWIETEDGRSIGEYSGVRPRAGAWIETGSGAQRWPRRYAFAPARGRGLKLSSALFTASSDCVRPRAGAWIETQSLRTAGHGVPVRPRAGAWIETSRYGILRIIVAFAPARGRGLKHVQDRPALRLCHVRPRAGAWIETLSRAAFARAARVRPRAGAWIETFHSSIERR